MSHDREFLNNVVTSTIVFEDGDVREYVGGYDDWLAQRPKLDAKATQPKSARRETKNSVQCAPPRKQQLAYHETRELELLPAKIESLEATLAELHEVISRPEFYKQPPTEIARQQTHVKDLDQQLAAAYRRWEELEQLAE